MASAESKSPMVKAAVVVFCLGLGLVTPLTGTANKFSTDLFTSGSTWVDDGAVQNSAGVLESIPDLPLEADLVAYHQRDNGDHLFALNITALLPGDVLVSPGDVVLYDDAAFSIIWTATENGLPSGVVTDAITEMEGQLILSFDTSVKLGDVTADDEDLIAFGSSDPVLYLDGTSLDLDSALDLDAITVLDADGIVLFMSFDTSGNVAGIDFNDEDVLLYRPDDESWRLFFKGTSKYAVADIDAFHAQLLLFRNGFE